MPQIADKTVMATHIYTIYCIWVEIINDFLKQASYIVNTKIINNFDFVGFDCISSVSIAK